MANLRTSTNNEKVRSYHNSYYRPDNLYLIVTGQVEPEQLFTALAPFEEKIKSKVNHLPSWLALVLPTIFVLWVGKEFYIWYDTVSVKVTCWYGHVAHWLRR